MHLKTLIRSTNGKVIMSIILGLGLATLFRINCYEKKCLVFYSKKPEDIEDKIFSEDDTCYKYSFKSSSCKTNKKKVRFA